MHVYTEINIRSLPFFSIIVPTYNRAKMLNLTLDTLLLQEYPKDKFEIIVCDNNSQDNTQQLLKQYSRNYPNKVVPIFEERQGAHYARNRSAHTARGDILYFTDDDMLATPRMLASFAEFLAKHPEAKSTTGRVLPFWESSPPQWILDICNNYLLSLNDLGGDEICSSTDIGVFSCHQAIPREIFLSTEGFHPENTAGEWIGDGETGLNITLRKMGYKFGYSPNAITYHMIPPSRMTQEYLNKRLANQGNCDSYTEFREYKYSPDKLMSRLPIHKRNIIAAKKLYKQQLHVNDEKWHLSLAYVYYHINRLKYDKRLAVDPTWRELVLRNDWNKISLYN